MSDSRDNQPGVDGTTPIHDDTPGADARAAELERLAAEPDHPDREAPAANKPTEEQLRQLALELAAEGDPDLKAGIVRAGPIDAGTREALTAKIPDKPKVTLPTNKVELKAKQSPASAQPVGAGAKPAPTGGGAIPPHPANGEAERIPDRPPTTPQPPTPDRAQRAARAPLVGPEDPTWVPVSATPEPLEDRRRRVSIVIACGLAVAASLTVYVLSTRTSADPSRATDPSTGNDPTGEGPAHDAASTAGLPSGRPAPTATTPALSSPAPAPETAPQPAAAQPAAAQPADAPPAAAQPADAPPAAAQPAAAQPASVQPPVVPAPPPSPAPARPNWPAPKAKPKPPAPEPKKPTPPPTPKPTPSSIRIF